MSIYSFTRNTWTTDLDLCNHYHITQKELVEKIGVSASQLSRIVKVESDCQRNARALLQMHGLEMFMEKQKEKYTCPKCGGIISMHDRECGECQEKSEIAKSYLL